jgi:acyl carrier protein
MREVDVPSRDAIAQEVGRMCATLLGRKKVPLDVSFIELGGDSLLLIALLTEIDDRFGVFLEAEDILADLSVVGMATAIAHASRAS